METADFDVNDFVGGKQNQGDEKLLLRFYTEAVKDEQKSLDEGRYVAREVDFVQICIPGNLNNMPVLQMDEFGQRRFGRQYDMWKANRAKQEQVTGTPLAAVSWLNRAQVAELNYFNILSLEHLAEASDQACQKISGLQSLKQKAKAFITASKETAPIEKLQAQIDELVANLAIKQQTIDELSARVDTKKPGKH